MSKHPFTSHAGQTIRSKMRRRRSRLAKTHFQRPLLFESLEDRRWLAVDWRNPVDAVDVDGDGFVVPLDALVVINDINANGARALPAVRTAGANYLDTSGDQFLAPQDALIVINYINAEGAQGKRIFLGRDNCSRLTCQREG